MSTAVQQAQRVVDAAMVGGLEPLHTVQSGGGGYTSLADRKTKGANCGVGYDTQKQGSTHPPEYFDKRQPWNPNAYFANQG